MSIAQAAAGCLGRVADNWDSLWAGAYGEAVRAAAISRAYLRPEMAVVDVGSGGFMAAGLAPLVAKVYAVDASLAMLEAGRQNLGAFGNFEQRPVDGAALPFDSASLDAVFANMHLHHCPDPETSIKEIVRVLKLGGRLVITDLDPHEYAWTREKTPAPAPDGAAAGAGVVDIWQGFERAAVKGWLRSAGLVNVIVECTSQDCRAASQADPAAHAAISVFVATGSRRVSGAAAHVQENYGALALNGGCCGAPASAQSGCSTSGSSCCAPAPNGMALIEVGPGEVVLWDTGYTAEQVSLAPVEAAALSLGCGNPTAIASLRPGETVLDIGSGAGIDVFHAARRVGSAGRVIGLDMTPAMIERARRSAEAAALTQVEFRLGQAEAMPVDDATVDVILSNCVINLAEDKGKVFEEALRVLKPGGRLSISDMVTAGPLPMSLRSDPQMWAGCINGALPEHEYLDLVRQAGFTDVVGQRSLSGGELAGVAVYSFSVSARKV